MSKVDHEYRHECKECGNKFNEKRSLEKHPATEHLKIRYKCDLCGMELVEEKLLIILWQELYEQSLV